MKNIITNIIGLAFFGIAIYESLSDTRSISFIIMFIVIGIVLFRYKWSETKSYIDRILNKSIDDNKSDIVANTVDPEIPEKPDDRG